MINVLSLHHVTKRFDGVVAVDDLSLEITEGSMCGLLGPNGAGKTTTIRMIMNIIAPEGGRIELFGEPFQEGLKDRIGYLPEERGLYGKMKVTDLLIFLAAIKGVPKHEAASRAEEWLKRLDLAEWRDKPVERLSKGMQQKLQFIATVLHDPELIILDEPFAGLDPVNTNLLKDIMLDLRKKGRTIIFSTHRMEQVEKLCERICLINKGGKVLEGDLSEIKRSAGRNTVRMEFDGNDAFLNDSRLIRSRDSYGNYVEIHLQEDADPQDLLRSALRHAAVTRFEVTEPSLNDIFIEVVGGKRDA